MLIGISLFLYHLLIIYLEMTWSYKWIYYVLALMTISLYPLSMGSKDERYSQITHSTMHIMGVTINMTVYYFLSHDRASILRLTV